MAQYQTSDNNILKNQPVTAVTAASYTATLDNTIIEVNFAGAVTVTLPAGSTTGVTANRGKFYVVKDISGLGGTNNITLTPAAGTIDGVGSVLVNSNYGSIQVFSDGVNWYSQTPGLGVTGASFSVNIQKLTGSGTYTPTANMAYCEVEVVGGGGGGSTTAGGNIVIGGGGGAGGYAKGVFTAAQIGVSQAVTIGSGGIAGVAGGTTTFGALLSATGGAGGVGGSGSSVASASSSSAGGVGTGGILQINGQASIPGFGIASGGTPYGSGGNGGSSPFGAGGRAGTLNASAGDFPGGFGLGNGSGGAGGTTGFGTGAAGGNGAQGIVVVTEYMFSSAGTVMNLSWTATAASTTVVSNGGYYTTGGSLVTLTLPASPAVGTLIAVNGVGAGGWRLQANGGQTIQFGNNASTSGGTLSSTNQYDAVELLVVSGTQFVVTYALGNLVLA